MVGLVCKKASVVEAAFCTRDILPSCLGEEIAMVVATKVKKSTHAV